MPGVKGMKQKPALNSARQKMWTTIRIKRRFDIRDLLITVPGAKADNARKLLNLLEKEGYITVIGGYVTGRGGNYKGYRLVKDAGPECPVKSPSVPARKKEGREERHHAARGSHRAAAAHY